MSTTELAPMHALDDHRPTHLEYAGGWWELACTGCDFALGRRLSHLDWAPHHAHRAHVFLEALTTAGYRRPSTITTVEELDAAILAALEDGQHLVLSDRHRRPWIIWSDEDGDEWVSSWPQEEDPERLTLGDIALPATVLYAPEAAK